MQDEVQQLDQALANIPQVTDTKVTTSDNSLLIRVTGEFNGRYMNLIVGTISQYFGEWKLLHSYGCKSFIKFRLEK